MLALDFDRVIPGHGPVTDREGLRAFQGFLRELWTPGGAGGARAEVARRRRSAMPRALGRRRLRRRSAIPFVFKLDREFVIRRAWEEATGAVTAVAGARERR